MANYKLLSAAKKVSFIGEKLYDYYLLSTACTHVANIIKDYDYLEVLKEIKEISNRYTYEKEVDIYILNRMQKHLFGCIKKIL